ncbi:MAG TPA: 4-coumarate--CoA ligase family protein [Pyrinomonadaceae bacterium]|jgi:acyl-CoA synthetase (AMP-forming)/AMP-acid ligase II
MIFLSSHKEVSIPETTLTEFVLGGAGRRAEKPALIDGSTGRRITYGELAQSVRRVAAGLAVRGFQKGDVLAVYSPNCPEYAIAFHAVASLGGINTTINPLYTTEEVAHQLKDAGAKYLLTVPQLMDRAQEAASRAGVRELFVFGEAEGATPFARLLETDEHTAAAVPAVSIDTRHDLVVLPYSSGTTGLPKGVMLTHRNLVANLCQLEVFKTVSDEDTLLCVLPMFHIYGMVVIMNLGLHAGATIVTMPRFELEQFLQLAQDHGVTLAHLVPPIVLALTKSPVVEQYDLSKLKTVFSGAAPLGEELTRACQERLDCRIIQGYGMTETSPCTHLTPLEQIERKPGSVGICLPNTECKLVNPDDGAVQGLRGKGEIWIRGPQVMKGYLNRPEATAQTIDEEGWLHTGDIAYADEDGHFYIVDRLKELIKYKGFQVAPAELEAVLVTHPCVADAAVIPSPDEEAGEVPKAFVVLRAEADAEDIMEFVAARVAPHKKIRHVEFIEQIPKSPSGKILRRVLKERERERVR